MPCANSMQMITEGAPGQMKKRRLKTIDQISSRNTILSPSGLVSTSRLNCTRFVRRIVSANYLLELFKLVELLAGIQGASSKQKELLVASPMGTTPAPFQ